MNTFLLKPHTASLTAANAVSLGGIVWVSVLCCSSCASSLNRKIYLLLDYIWTKSHSFWLYELQAKSLLVSNFRSVLVPLISMCTSDSCDPLHLYVQNKNKSRTIILQPRSRSQLTLAANQRALWLIDGLLLDKHWIKNNRSVKVTSVWIYGGNTEKKTDCRQIMCCFYLEKEGKVQAKWRPHASLFMYLCISILF